MKTIYGRIGSFHKLGNELAITIGNFDGVHLGHQELIKETKKYNMKTAVFTFNPHPLCIVKSDFNYNFLTPLDRKIELIRKLNPDYLFIIDFNRKGASVSKTDFIEWLKKLNVKVVISGSDWRFGYKGEGSISDLENIFKTKVIDTVTSDNVKISSSYIKELLRNGNILKANELLGRDYYIEGKVVKGNGLGNKLGFRTANIDIFGNVPPKKGVYYVNVKLHDKLYKGMCNIGYNPTISNQNPLKLETHIFDFDQDIYGEEIKVYFKKYIREEIKFNTSNELKEQLLKDKMEILNLE